MPLSAQSPLLSTGSFSGFRTKIEQLGHHYLSADKSAHQAFCGNAEGWGPLSKERYDFTPCFMDVWVSTVAVYGVLFGAVAVWWLLRRKQKAEVGKDWHFWVKQVGFAFLTTNEDIVELYMVYGEMLTYTGPYYSYSHLSSYPTALPNPQLPQRLGRRFPLLDIDLHHPLARCNLRHPMARARSVTESQWRRIILLALPAHRLLRQAALPHLPADIQGTSALLRGVLCGIWIELGGVWTGVVGAEE